MTCLYKIIYYYLILSFHIIPMPIRIAPHRTAHIALAYKRVVDTNKIDKQPAQDNCTDETRNNNPKIDFGSKIISTD